MKKTKKNPTRNFVKLLNLDKISLVNKVLNFINN